MNYNFINVPVKPKTVTVITPTIGSPKLQDAINSVQRQTYGFVQHLIVIDGVQYHNDVIVNATPRSCTNYTTAPENTGANGFYGHRIYAAYPHLINSDYIFFLDEDNWYEPNHVETLVKKLEQGNEFAYSLRKIFDQDKNYLCLDNCESLGKYPIFFSHGNPQYHVDTSSFAFRREFLVRFAHIWHHGWGGDRRFYNAVKSSRHDVSGEYTLCYRLDGNVGSVKEEFFLQGNTLNHNHYEGKFPWLTT
jgi:glycosyltransferase involved in cell wall biosynthesis